MKPYYEHGGITLYHGDCCELIPALAFDVVVTDPLYGIAYVSRNRKENWGSIVGDDNMSARDNMLALIGTKPAAVFGTWKRSRPANTRIVLIWSKGACSGVGDTSLPWRPSFEEVYVLGVGWRGQRGEAVLSVPAVHYSAMRHPTEKPVGILRELVGKAPPGVVLDPFCGSGTTLVAARDLGRRAVGIEIEERYCEAAARRLEQCVLPLANAEAPHEA